MTDATRLRNLKIRKVDRCFKGANQESNFVFYKAACSYDHSKLGKGEKCPECGSVMKSDPNATITPDRNAPQGGTVMPTEAEQLESLKKAMDDAITAALKKHDEDIVAFGKAATPPSEEDVFKSLPREVQERITKAEAEGKRNAERIEKMLDDKLKAETMTVAKGLPFVAVAKDDDPPEANATDQLGGLLYDLSKALDEDVFKSVVDLLESAQTKLAKAALFAEAGRGGVPVTGQRMTALEKAAEELRKSDPNLTVPASIRKAAQDNPELAAQAQEEDITHA